MGNRALLHCIVGDFSIKGKESDRENHESYTTRKVVVCEKELGNFFRIDPPLLFLFNGSTPHTSIPICSQQTHSLAAFLEKYSLLRLFSYTVLPPIVEGIKRKLCSSSASLSLSFLTFILHCLLLAFSRNNTLFASDVLNIYPHTYKTHRGYTWIHSTYTAADAKKEGRKGKRKRERLNASSNLQINLHGPRVYERADG